MIRRHWLRLAGSSAAATALAPLAAKASPARPRAVVFALRNPGCGCCVGWADHLREHGYEVVLHDSPDLVQVKNRLGIPADLHGCHTALVEGYRVEGHVPAEFVTRLLDERPDGALGIAVPGMPVGSPGMEGPNPEAYDVMAFGAPDVEPWMFGRVEP